MVEEESKDWHVDNILPLMQQHTCSNISQILKKMQLKDKIKIFYLILTKC